MASPWPKWYSPPRRSPFPADTVRNVANAFGINYSELIGRGRAGHLIEARSVAARLLRDRGMSYPHIGRHIGGRDHSTVINAVDKFDIYCRRCALAEQVYQSLREANNA